MSTSANEQAKRSARQSQPGGDPGPRMPPAVRPGTTSAHVTPFYCPYCGEEDLRPAGERHGDWECRGCTRVFSLKFAGLAVRT